MDTQPLFGFQDACRVMIGEMAAAVCERTGETPQQRSNRFEAAVCTIEAFRPRGVLETMLAGHCMMYHAVLVDTVGGNLRGDADPKWSRSRGNVITLNNSFIRALDQLKREQARREQERHEASRLAAATLAAAHQTAASEVAASQAAAAPDPEAPGSEAAFGPAEEPASRTDQARAVPVQAEPTPAAVVETQPDGASRQTVAAQPPPVRTPVVPARSPAEAAEAMPRVPVSARPEPVGTTGFPAARPAADQANPAAIATREAGAVTVRADHEHRRAV